MCLLPAMNIMASAKTKARSLQIINSTMAQTSILLPTMNIIASAKTEEQSLQIINSTVAQSFILLADLKAGRFWQWRFNSGRFLTPPRQEQIITSIKYLVETAAEDRSEQKQADLTIDSSGCKVLGAHHQDYSTYNVNDSCCQVIPRSSTNLYSYTCYFFVAYLHLSLVLLVETLSILHEKLEPKVIVATSINPELVRANMA
ncbi:uncharacterized protein LOC108844690 isoform X2 [Raphanus sativus]|uniref:Uncharacterized protein LOC108844690 isoform X2 n=1 Tax=Raphanus sativus TaxID=3726 RepID=A0A9W3DI49_RAPSA|nr:uncharacterized protein LOC130506264 isoform X2 [Raphanus sativus]XP_056863510.1 uncharacterized protein LOC108844690 isoform X2 [Raphanus sativus]